MFKLTLLVRFGLGRRLLVCLCLRLWLGLAKYALEGAEDQQSQKNASEDVKGQRSVFLVGVRLETRRVLSCELDHFSDLLSLLEDWTEISGWVALVVESV